MSTIRDAVVVTAELVSEEAPKLNGGDPRICHSAAFALRNVLDYFGFDSTVVPVDVLVVRRHKSIPGGGYLATCGNPPNPFDDSQSTLLPTKPVAEGLIPSDYHSVVFVDGMMVDPTAGQFARPQYGIEIPAFIYANVDEAGLANLPTFKVPQDAYMQYSRSSVEEPYVVLNTGQGSWVRTIAGAVIRRMKQEMKRIA
jgi:hypothetical protein